MYIFAQKLQKSDENLKKRPLSSISQYILLFSFIYFTSVIILLNYTPPGSINELNYNDETIISNKESKGISRQIPLYTINISNNTIVGSLRISSSRQKSEQEKNKFEISGYLYYKSNIFNMKYMLVSGESCHNWKGIVQDISNKITFKSRKQLSQGTKVFRKIRETSFELSNRIELASHFIIIQNIGRKFKQIACTPLNNATKTNTF